MFVATAVCLTALILFTTKTRMGIAWRATVSNPKIATSFGVNAIQVALSEFL